MSAFKKWVTVEYSKIPQWKTLTNHQYATRFRHEVRALEKQFREERSQEGKRVAGLAKLAKLDYRDRPETPRKRTRQPICHASTPGAAAEYEVDWRT